MKKKITPQIKLYGWWWKQFIPTFRKRRKIMQAILDYEWENGGEEELQRQLTELTIFGKVKYPSKYDHT